MEFQHQELIVELTDDRRFNPTSADNVVTYKKVYGYKDYTRSPAIHAIRVKAEDEEIANAIFFGYGGATTIHDKSYVIADEDLFLCCGDSVYSIRLPFLDLNWHKKMDWATCMEIYKFDGDFIIHGELDLKRFAKDGSIIWSFSGNDIFVSPTLIDDFSIVDDIIIAKDYYGKEYRINGDGKVI